MAPTPVTKPTGILSITLACALRRSLVGAAPQMRGQLLFGNLFQERFHALTHSGFHVLFDNLIPRFSLQHRLAPPRFAPRMALTKLNKQPHN